MMRRLLSPSGGIEVELMPEVGGRIHAIRADGVNLLRTPDDVRRHEIEPLLWGSYPMVPWCNRIPRGELWFEGAMHRQPLTLDAFAVHGRAFAAPWRVLPGGTLEYVDYGDSGFPWPFRARQEFTVLDTGVSLELSIENTGSVSMPAGLGIHPWFEASGGLEIALPAEQVYPSAGNIPTGPPVPVSGIRDLRTPGLPRTGMDECWTGLTANRIELHRLVDDIRISFSFTARADHVVLAAVGGMDAVAIEPQTHGVNGHLHREHGVPGAIGVLAPGQLLTVTYGVTIRH